MKYELDALEAKGTWEVTDVHAGEKAIDSKWV